MKIFSSRNYEKNYRIKALFWRTEWKFLSINIPKVVKILRAIVFDARRWWTFFLEIRLWTKHQASLFIIDFANFLHLRAGTWNNTCREKNWDKIQALIYMYMYKSRFIFNLITDWFPDSIQKIKNILSVEHLKGCTFMWHFPVYTWVVYR